MLCQRANVRVCKGPSRTKIETALQLGRSGQFAFFGGRDKAAAESTSSNPKIPLWFVVDWLPASPSSRPPFQRPQASSMAKPSRPPPTPTPDLHPLRFTNCIFHARATGNKHNTELNTRLLMCDCDAHAIRKPALPQSAISCINTLPYTTLYLHHCSTVRIPNQPIPGLKPIHTTLLVLFQGVNVSRAPPHLVLSQASIPSILHQ